ncbi:hypothetical protein KKH27_12970 [bacterium]|nr:hypothetical protein [bacterium]MBU1983172.1 hypothetical protein [bacterium]
MRYLLCGLAFILLPLPIMAQVETVWTREYDGACRAVAVMPDGGILITGESRHPQYFGDQNLLLRLNPDGDTLWTRAFGTVAEMDCSEVSEEFYGATGRMKVSSAMSIRRLFVNPDGSFLTFSDCTEENRQNCRCLTTWNDSGNFVGRVPFCATGINIIFDLNRTADGQFVAFGNPDPHVMNGNRFFVMRVSVRGDTLDYRSYEKDDFHFHEVIKPCRDGGYLLAGSSGKTIVSRIDPRGNKLWDYQMDERGVEFGDVGETDDGGFVIVGHTSRKGSTEAAGVAFKMDARGALLWQRSFAAGAECRSRTLDVLDNGELLMGGSFDRRKDARMFLMLTTNSGDSLWTKEVGHGEMRGMVKTPDGGYLLAGNYPEGDYPYRWKIILTRVTHIE